MDWANLLTTPISLVGVFAILAGLQKAGVDVIGIVKKLFVSEQSQKTLMDQISEILESQVKLRSHFNDETTVLLSDISKGIDQINNKHQEWDKFGIPTRDCEKKK